MLDRDSSYIVQSFTKSHKVNYRHEVHLLLLTGLIHLNIINERLENNRVNLAMLLSRRSQAVTQSYLDDIMIHNVTSGLYTKQILILIT